MKISKELERINNWIAKTVVKFISLIEEWETILLIWEKYEFVIKKRKRTTKIFEYDLLKWDKIFISEMFENPDLFFNLKK